jgi:ABC-type nitrate/sulfonate/bicarbonate transport system permease component
MAATPTLNRAYTHMHLMTRVWQLVCTVMATSPLFVLCKPHAVAAAVLEALQNTPTAYSLVVVFWGCKCVCAPETE